MADLRADLEQHLRHALEAYGADLVLPPGTVLPRTALATSVAPVADGIETNTVDTTGQEMGGQEVAAARAAPARAVPARPPIPARSPSSTRASGTAPAAPQTPPADPTTIALQQLQQQVAACTACRLHEGRTRTVFGEGNPRAEVLFVGEAPGFNEDRSGRPFVGKAGQLLTRIINGAMGLRRDEVYIANVNKCRPPDNRDPTPDEAGACLPFLRRQVELVRPKVIVCLGRIAVHNLLGRTESVGALRGQPLDYLGIPVVVTWHPSYLLREPSRKQETWLDIIRVNVLIGRPEKPEPVTEDA